MSRDWKPGDVAMIDGRVALAWREVAGRLSFVYTDAAGYSCSVWADTADERPLVVIDPEDPEQVKQLTRALDRHFDGYERPALRPEDFESMQAALREFANPKPPKPDEPTSPLAIVEDASGVRWYRMPEKRVPDHLWAAFDDRADYDRDWSDIDAVRVVSEGVQP